MSLCLKFNVVVCGICRSVAPRSIVEDSKQHYQGLNEGMSARPVMVSRHIWHHVLLLKIVWKGAEATPG